jgi:hypothetical protein
VQRPWGRMEPGVWEETCVDAVEGARGQREEGGREGAGGFYPE